MFQPLCKNVPTQLLQTADTNLFDDFCSYYTLYSNFIINERDISSMLEYLKVSAVENRELSQIKEKVGRRLLKIIQDTFSAKKSIFDTEYRTF